MRTLIVIPARLSSKRLPRKLLLAETGKPLIQHVVDVAKSIEGDGLFYRPLVAFDSDDRFHEITLSTRDCATIATGVHPNGTSRAHWAMELAGIQPDIVLILQADEPEIDPAHLHELVQALQQHPEWDCATLAKHSKPDDTDVVRNDANRPKVFYPIMSPPVAVDFVRDMSKQSYPKSNWALHIGIYAYRTAALQRYAAAGPCERETAESLEQLRALHIGLRMGVVLVDHRGHGINTREDYDAFVKRWKEKNGASGNAEDSRAAAGA